MVRHKIVRREGWMDGWMDVYIYIHGSVDIRIHFTGAIR